MSSSENVTVDITVNMRVSQVILSKSQHQLVFLSDLLKRYDFKFDSRNVAPGCYSASLVSGGYNMRQTGNLIVLLFVFQDVSFVETLVFQNHTECTCQGPTSVQ